MRCLLIDNYDSFSHILADHLGQVFGQQPLVVYNDQYDWVELQRRFSFDCVVISPGPGSVVKPQDFGVSGAVLAQPHLPVFGVCLGMQGIAHQHGAVIEHCPLPYHGRQSPIIHNGDEMFAGVPSPFTVVRYHSLMVALKKDFPLIATASSPDGVIQALRHKTLPQWGVQFHPESILTEHGNQLLTNFRDQAHRYINKAHWALSSPAKPPAGRRQPLHQKILFSRRLPLSTDAESIFTRLFAAEPHSFWLDSQTAENARFCFMGCGEPIPLLRYRLAEDEQQLSGGHAALTAMDRLLSDTEVVHQQPLPFDFCGGLVGYFSYEMKALFGAKRHFENSIPDMLWLQVDRFVACDHHTQSLYLVALGEQAQDAEPWFDQICARLAQQPSQQSQPQWQRAGQSAKSQGVELSFTMDAGIDEYIKVIDHCHQAIVEGDSYEVCLTNHFTLNADIDAYRLYLSMRHGNSAPFGAWLHSDDVSVLSTSPERFIEVAASGRIEAKPIKGTCERASDPQQDDFLAQQLAVSEKDRAENLMIVDLMRNDLSRVSVPGSVVVPKLMDIESFKTVHQMVSTVQSQLADEYTLMDLIKATFPGGSISGAPKLRTMEIIDALEQSPRGVYCGAIGYLGYNRVADLNIGIRTLSYHNQQLRFGAGGAITYLSEPQAEFNEILLKANAVIKPIWQFFGGSTDKMTLDIVDKRLSVYHQED